MVRFVAILFLVATILATCHASNRGHSFQNFPLQMKTESDKKICCPSWRLGVEAHNIIGWKTVPGECAGYVEGYIRGGEYQSDSKAVTDEAYSYALDYVKNHTIGDKDIWVFDIDETLILSDDFYAKYDYGAKSHTPTDFFEWVSSGGKSKQLRHSHDLYNNLLDLGINIVLLTGRPKNMTEVTKNSLKDLDYHNWTKLILIDYKSIKPGNTTIHGSPKVEERKKLVKKGYNIIGNIGDQWSDILGDYPGNRTFKLPNPMYYT